MATSAFSEDEIAYEEDIRRNSTSAKAWLRYIDFIKRREIETAIDESEKIILIFERSLKTLSNSYKIWKNYIDFLLLQLNDACINDARYLTLNDVMERCMSYMHKMPRLWIIFVEELQKQKLIRKTRRTFDRALSALPLTLHHRLWPYYIKFVKEINCIDTGIRVYRRWVSVFPENMESFIDYLVSVHRYDEAASRLVEILNDTTFISKKKLSKLDLWNELCELISSKANDIHSVNVEAIMRQAILKMNDCAGALWIGLAEYYSRRLDFDKARDIFEEALTKVMTVHDFTLVFDTYSLFEENLVNQKMVSIIDENGKSDDSILIEYHLARLTYLLERRSLLVNDVMLRQNKNNVYEWLKRIKIYEEMPNLPDRDIYIINTYSKSVEMVEAEKSVGKYSDLWISFAKYYEKKRHINIAREIYAAACEATYKTVDDLANIWCDRIEFELRFSNIDYGRQLMQRCTSMTKEGTADYYDSNKSCQQRLYKNIRLWSLYSDIEECFGTLNTTSAVYEEMIDLHIITPQLIINYANLLRQQHYYERSFQVYEKGIALFRWPHVKDIWLMYLLQFTERFNGEKLERGRDLFEQCLANCPSSEARVIYKLYGKMEKNFGINKRVIETYERCIKTVKMEEKLSVYLEAIAVCKELRGIIATRPLYEKAIEELNDEHSRMMCLKFAQMETQLGEIDRARSIYIHCSQMCDPRYITEFWQKWKSFELVHGNENTLKEMLRIRRSVQASFNVQANLKLLAAAHQKTSEENEDNQVSTSSLPVNFVKGETIQNNGESKTNDDKNNNMNPEEIEIDDDEEEEEEDNDNENQNGETDDDESKENNEGKDEDNDLELDDIEKKNIPDNVFGSLMKQN
ncbi:hypothetical protein SNEBB_010652 [Seison nebaliae]|nr:hypothetical protein SNEBB_010652 [Seison nebaliae]